MNNSNNLQFKSFSEFDFSLIIKDDFLNLNLDKDIKNDEYYSRSFEFSSYLPSPDPKYKYECIILFLDMSYMIDNEPTIHLGFDCQTVDHDAFISIDEKTSIKSFSKQQHPYFPAFVFLQFLTLAFETNKKLSKYFLFDHEDNNKYLKKDFNKFFSFLSKKNLANLDGPFSSITDYSESSSRDFFYELIEKDKIIQDKIKLKEKLENSINCQNSVINNPNKI